ncbi:type II secretion system protein, partial [bacterium]|nr:type II secretion system protein [bacterium]
MIINKKYTKLGLHQCFGANLDRLKSTLHSDELPSLARLCRANNPVNCLVFLFESYARVIEKGLRVGLFPVMGNHTATEKNSSLRGRIEVGANPVRGKAAFTLAEGATHTNTPPLVAKAAFTLAEVLITLAIIGVVAALTLPTLIAKVNEKVDGNQKKVTEAKLIQGLNMLDLHG